MPALSPRWGLREQLFLHFCAGPRREGDVCCWVERLVWEDGVVPSAIVYGPMNDPSMDLADASEFRRWQLACERGDVAGLLASPRCSIFLGDA